MGYSKICFDCVELQVLEGLSYLDVQYADLCVGLQHRRREKLRQELQITVAEMGVKYWRRNGYVGRAPDGAIKKCNPGCTNV